jgi:hypothetical protein
MQRAEILALHDHRRRAQGRALQDDECINLADAWLVPWIGERFCARLAAFIELDMACETEFCEYKRPLPCRVSE